MEGAVRITHITAIRLPGLLGFRVVQIAGRCRCGAALTTSEVFAPGGKADAPLVGEVGMCVKCVVMLLVKAAIGQNYSGGEVSVRHKGLELEVDTGEINGTCTDDDGRRVVGYRGRRGRVLACSEAG
jgi:hypothetical protein